MECCLALLVAADEQGFQLIMIRYQTTPVQPLSAILSLFPLLSFQSQPIGLMALTVGSSPLMKRLLCSLCKVSFSVY